MCKNLTMGHIKLYRKIQQWEWYGEPNMVAIWVHLLLNANWEDGEWRGMEVKRGQLITSVHSLSVETGLSVSQVRTCLNRLRDSKQVSIETTRQMTKLTICNYDSYQSNTETESQTNRKQDIKRDNNQIASQIATNKEYKNIRNEEIKKVSNDTKESKRFTKPTVEQINAYFQEIGFDESPNSFFDYYESKGWVVGNSPMKDWKAAARTWMHKRNKNGESLFPKESLSPQVPPGPPSPPPLRPYRDLLRMYPKEYMESDENYARRLVMIEERMKAEGEWCYEERPK